MLYLFPRFWPAAVVWSAVSQQEIPPGSPTADPRSFLSLEAVAGFLSEGRSATRDGHWTQKLTLCGEFAAQLLFFFDDWW